MSQPAALTGREILDRWEVTFVALEADNDDLTPFIEASIAWERLHQDDEGVVYRRVE